MDGNLKLRVYRKKTHTNQYLSFNSHHPLHQKLGVVRTLLDRCEGIISEEQDRVEERDTIKSALQVCGYPPWAIEKVKKQQLEKGESKNSKQKKHQDRKDQNKGMVVLPYVAGVSEKLARIFKKRQVSTAMRPHTTLKGLLVHPKDKSDPKEGVYRIDCGGCDKVYVGETKRALKTRVGEHRKEVEELEKSMVYTRSSRKASYSDIHKSAITDHVAQENHMIEWEKAKIVDRERDWMARGVREAIVIRQFQNKCMNRDEGRFNLSHLYDDLLQSQPRD